MKYFLIFFYNLMFSSMKESERIQVIDQSLSKLLKLVKKKRVKIAISLTGNTIEIIKQIRPHIINELRTLIKLGYIELIGSGYSQIIQPLVPNELNEKNIKYGLELYKKYFEIVPETACCNEGVYSFSGAKILEKFKYKNLIMEWNNFYKNNMHLDKSQFYYSGKLNGSKINLIWYNTILFQALQRFVKNEINEKSYVQIVKNFKKKKGYLCLYASDGEIFGYNPKRYKDDVIKGDPWKKIEKIIDIFGLKNFTHVKEISKTKKNSKKLSLTDSKNPILVRKQNKYTINRWAITGRNDSKLNAFCYQIFDYLKKNKIKSRKNYNELLNFWSSDYRTHIEINRWKKVNKQNQFYIKNIIRKNKIVSFSSKNIFNIKGYKKKNESIIKFNFKKNYLKLNLNKGSSIDSWLIRNKQTICTIPFNKYDDINLGADFFSGNALIEPSGQRKISDLKKGVNFQKNNKNSFSLITKIKNENYHFHKKYIYFNKGKNIELFTKISLLKRQREKIRLLSLTFDSKIFDKNTLFYSVNLGGKELETFKLGYNNIDHEKNLNLNISSYQGFAATEGRLIIGDKKNKCLINFDQSLNFLMTQILYKNFPDKKDYFFRINFSAQEIDETFRINTNKYEVFNHFKISWNL